MVIYGVGLLSFCMLVGMFVGDLLGEVMGVQANVGGVGIARVIRRCAISPQQIGEREAGHGLHFFCRRCAAVEDEFRLAFAIVARDHAPDDLDHWGLLLRIFVSRLEWQAGQS